MRILAIDPGNEQSAWLIFDTIKQIPIAFGIESNADLYRRTERYASNRSLPLASVNFLVIEMIASYGMPVGKTVFETCVWIGQFISHWWWSDDYMLIYRSEIKTHLCNSVRAKDSNIRQALIDRFGGSRDKAIGTKKNQGVLYGISKDLWSALAVAVTYADQQKKKELLDGQ